MTLIVCLLAPVLHCVNTVQDALADLPSREAVRVMLCHWSARVRHLEEGLPFCQHCLPEHRQALQHARKAREVWCKVDSVLYPHYSWKYRRECVQWLRERGYFK